jgi:hypothetical protein
MHSTAVKRVVNAAAQQQRRHASVYGSCNA